MNRTQVFKLLFRFNKTGLLSNRAEVKSSFPIKYPTKIIILQGSHAVLKVLKKYWISKSVFKTLKKYWNWPKYAFSIEKVWKFEMENNFEVSEQNFTEGKVVRYLCNVQNW